MSVKTIKAISLWQPWASLIAIGAKQYETRHWRTNYRGLLAIHAAKRWTAEEKLTAEIFAEYPAPTQNALLKPLPLGAVLCVVNLVNVIPTDRLDVGFPERAFGNFAYGRFAWKLELVEVFDHPVPAKGAQGLWLWQWEGGE